MEGVTLMESGTSRMHFALLKQVEAAKSDAQADRIILSTIAEVQSALSSKHSLSSSSLASHLFVLLHCLELYPISANIQHTRPSIQFALVSCLQVAATATKAKDIALAYTLLRKIYEAQDSEEQQQTSLLALNTIRKHLEPDTAATANKGKEKAKPISTALKANHMRLSHVSFALKSIISGFPSGSDIFPALYGPIALLCWHYDEGIQGLALDALDKIQSYVEYDESIEKADWERSRGLVSGYMKRRHFETTKSETLPRALLRAIRRALKARVIDVHEACHQGLALLEAQPEIAIASLQMCMSVLQQHGGADDVLQKIKSLAADTCLRQPDSYSILLSSVSIIGELAMVGGTSNTKIEHVWTLIKSHLSAKNANRKLLALGALQAFLPYSWPKAGNESGLYLEEAEMSLLMGMLGDRDESVRTRALHLFHKIDVEILAAHYSQLVQVSRDETRPDLERKELSHRAIEVAGERFARGSVEASYDCEQYVDAIDDILAFLVDASIDDDTIRLILVHLRRTTPLFSADVFLRLLKKQKEHADAPSSTQVLLFASLACELGCDESSCEDILALMTSMLPYLDGQAVLMEAMLVGIIKTAFNAKDIPDQVRVTISKLSESVASSVIKHRLRQVMQVLNDTDRKDMFPSGTLLSTMERLESSFASKTSLSSADTAGVVDAIATPRAPKPLKYEAYQDSVLSSPTNTSPSIVKQPFSALPRPSADKDDTKRRQRRLQEDSIRDEMQKSIARLTLGEEEVGAATDEEEDFFYGGEESAKGKESEAVLF